MLKLYFFIENLFFLNARQSSANYHKNKLRTIPNKMDLKENSCLSASIEIGRKRQKSVINCQPEYGIHI